MSMALRKSIPLFLLGVLWLVEVLALMLYPPGVSRWYSLWGMSFIPVHQLASYFIFGSVSYYIGHEELPPLKQNAKAAYAALASFLLLGSSISFALYVAKGYWAGALGPVLTAVLLVCLYRCWFDTQATRSGVVLISAGLFLSLLLPCICPILRPVDVELQGAAYSSEDMQRIQDVTLQLKGHQRRYLLRDDVLDITLHLNEREMQCDRAPFYLPEESLYYVYFHFYEPTRNHYIGAKLVYDKYFYNVMVVIDDENAIYATSINDAATQSDFDLPKPFAQFLNNHQD